MIIIGLTGGSGSGKGYVASLFAKAGVPSLDTDMVSRLVCMPGSDCVRELTERFGTDIIKSDGVPAGNLDRAKLAAIAFADRASTDALNNITHKHILNYCRRWLCQRQEDGCPAAIIDAPQLFESGFNAECDAVVAVTADRALRLRRILERDGITPEQAELRLSRQHDEEFYRTHADYIIENNYDKSNPDNGALAAQVTAVLRALGLTEDAT
jgi:dephospho-CoA kinase